MFLLLALALHFLFSWYQLRKFLTSIRKFLLFSAGDFIMIEPIEEGDKVKGEITHILFKDQIKHIQENDLW